MKNKRNVGFTLIELLVVLAILALLAVWSDHKSLVTWGERSRTQPGCKSSNSVKALICS